MVHLLESDEEYSKTQMAQRDNQHISIESLIERAYTVIQEEYPRAKMISVSRQFAKKASPDELKKLAFRTLLEENEIIQALLLLPFRRTPFPLDMTPLIHCTKSENKLLSEISVEVLGQLRDKRIHELAIELLESRGLESGVLEHLKKNYAKTDDGLIRKLILKSKTIPHHVQIDLVDIYTHHHSKNAGDILIHVYKNGDCSFCRHGIIEAMHHCGVLPAQILQECLYDSYEDTRKWAKRILKNQKRL